jgi:xylulokinase
VPEITLGAAYGDAFLAGLGAGAFASYQDIRGWTRAARTVVPNPDHAAGYRRSFELYLDLYRTNKSLMHRLTAQL